MVFCAVKYVSVMGVYGTVRPLEHAELKTLVLHDEGEDASVQADSVRGQTGNFIRASRVQIDHVH